MKLGNHAILTTAMEILNFSILWTCFVVLRKHITGHWSSKKSQKNSDTVCKQQNITCGRDRFGFLPLFLWPLTKEALSLQQISLTVQCV